MVTYLDTQSGGINNDLTQGGTFQWSLNLGTKFWLNAANNIIPGQPIGQNVTFKVWDIRGSQEVTIMYGKGTSRQVRGHLVTTVPATLPANPNVDIHIILDDDEVPLTAQLTGSATVTGAGGSSIQNNLGFTGSLTLYTCPPTFQADVLLVNWATTDNIDIRVFSGENVDDLTGVQTGAGSLGQGSKATVVINPPKHLGPGDTLQLYDSTASPTGGIVGYSIHQYPI